MNIETEVNDHRVEGGDSSREETSTICVLHMLVPVSARRRAKLAAVASGMPFRDYVTYLLSNADPINQR